MKTKLLMWVFSAFFLVVAIAACRKTDEEHLSQNGATESHNMGQNCLSCHYRGGPGEIRFYIGGTIYDSTGTTPQANGKVEFYDALTGGNLVLTLEVDANGNFYTANYVNLNKGLYPRVVSAGGQVKQMGSQLSDGGCASCHGASQSKIWVN